MRLRMGLSAMTNRFLDAVFPPNCAVCGRDGVWFCEECLSLVELVKRDPCSRCGSLKLEHDCAHAGVIHELLQGLAAVGYYHDPRLRKLLHALKYQYATCLLPSVGDLLRRYKNMRSQSWPWAGESALALQAVVGAPKRIRTRGFDQAEQIRDLVKRELIPWAEIISLLGRSFSVEAQADLEPGPLRQANVCGVFKCVAPSSDVPEVVVLVDDVFTTGSTMFEAARVLRSAGVKRVYGLVLAIGA